MNAPADLPPTVLASQAAVERAPEQKPARSGARPLSARPPGPAFPENLGRSGKASFLGRGVAFTGEGDLVDLPEAPRCAENRFGGGPP